MTYNFRSIVNHVLRKTEFGPVSESIDSQFNGNNIDPIVDRIKDWTNEVYLEICNAGFWRFLETESTFETVIGQEAYSTSADCSVNRIINIRETSTPAVLKRVDFKTIDKLYPATTAMSGGNPNSYYFVGNQIYLYPVPDRAVTIKYRYYKTVTDMKEPDDVPEIPEQWKWVLVNGVLVRANQYLQDQSLKDAQLLYLDGLLQMRATNRSDIQHKNSIKPF